MSVVSLRDEENLAVLSDEFVDSMGDLDGGTEQVEVLKSIRKLIRSSSPERHIYEKLSGCDILEVVRASDLLRVYCKLVLGIPQSNKTYNLLFLFSVSKHKYRDETLTTLDEAAKEQIERIEDFDSLDGVEYYLDERQALDEDDLTHLIENGQGAFG